MMNHIAIVFSLEALKPKQKIFATSERVTVTMTMIVYQASCVDRETISTILIQVYTVMSLMDLTDIEMMTTAMIQNMVEVFCKWAHFSLTSL